ncbi:MAG: CDP-diacylglycerol--serine O-phosphatidyltransferase [Campylobacter sp.]|uniref:CDP-diacylglycerol--serine O-phosphatidyltransferase n=1 Tax=Campylobacter sp. TaxID=205 RepID=UPI002AA8E690|nr:CDP-diacylglycerol--serine O-phosphatidyltransferase [Campylobacter sp.]MCI7014747.1 CDP-diacylglycerol--serine O-phosphatidyltransferase [Campylobacter sp.]
MNEKLKLIYILPNLFTAASIFLGVLSVLSSIKGDFSVAIIYIVLSFVFDGLDGRVARLTNTTSKFGVEFDSLADIVAFGVAPAMLFYFSVGQDFGRFGVLITALFVIFGGVRLARFNVMSGASEPNVFIGLPIPAAAVLLALWIGLWDKYEIFKGYEYVLLAAAAVFSVLMVSNVRFPSFKKINYERANFIRFLILLLLILSLIYIYLLEASALCLSLYVLYGVVRWVWARFFAKHINLKQNVLK